MDESQIPSQPQVAPHPPVAPEPAEAGGEAPLEVGPALPVPTIIPVPVVVPKPKPIIIPERVDDGWRTPSLHMRRASAGLYLTLHPGAVGAQVIHLTFTQLESLTRLLEAEQGVLWRKLAEIPLERPLPNRALEEELRVMLRSFGFEMRPPRYT
jgi:hypothetical protein